MTEQAAPTETAEPAENLTARPRRIAFWKVILVALVAGLALWVWGLLDSRIPTHWVAPDFTLHAYDGTTYQLSALRGQVVVINFWATWCGPCHAEAPQLQALSESLHKEGVVFLGVDQVDKLADAQAFIKQYNITYPTGLDDSGIVDAYGIQGLPTTFIVNQQGEVVYRTLAAIDPGDLQAKIEATLHSSPQE